jgi:hypothetical protein
MKMFIIILMFALVLMTLRTNAALTIDNAIAANSAASPLVISSFSTNGPNAFILVVVIHGDGYATPSITDTAGLTYNLRIKQESGVNPNFYYFNAIATSKLTNDQITITPGSIGFGVVAEAVAILGANLVTPFDTNPTIEANNINDNFGLAINTLISTNQANDMILNLMAFDTGVQTNPYPTANFNTVIVDSPANSMCKTPGDCIYISNYIVSSLQTNLVSGFTVAANTATMKLVTTAIQSAQQPASTLGRPQLQPSLSVSNVIDTYQVIGISANIPVLGTGVAPYTYNFMVFNSVTNVILGNFLDTCVASLNDTYYFAPTPSMLDQTIAANVQITDSAFTNCKNYYANNIYSSNVNTGTLFANLISANFIKNVNVTTTNILEANTLHDLTHVLRIILNDAGSNINLTTRTIVQLQMGIGDTPNGGSALQLSPMPLSAFSTPASEWLDLFPNYRVLQLDTNAGIHHLVEIIGRSIVYISGSGHTAYFEFMRFSQTLSSFGAGNTPILKEIASINASPTIGTQFDNRFGIIINNSKYSGNPTVWNSIGMSIFEGGDTNLNNANALNIYPISAATNKTAIWQAGLAEDNFFAGNTIFGSNNIDPTTNFEVIGNSLIGNMTSNAISANILTITGNAIINTITTNIIKFGNPSSIPVNELPTLQTNDNGLVNNDASFYMISLNLIGKTATSKVAWVYNTLSTGITNEYTSNTNIGLTNQVIQELLPFGFNGALEKDNANVILISANTVKLK